MRLSTKGRYAVRAMVDLSYYSRGHPVSLKEIAEREKISISYLEQLFLRLKRGGLVNSIRGPSGGYILRQPSEEILIYEIIEKVDEPLDLVHCVKVREGENSCPNTKTCVTREVWMDLTDHVLDFLRNITLEDLRRRKGELLREEAAG